MNVSFACFRAYNMVDVLHNRLQEVYANWEARTNIPRNSLDTNTPILSLEGEQSLSLLLGLLLETCQKNWLTSAQRDLLKRLFAFFAVFGEILAECRLFQVSVGLVKACKTDEFRAENSRAKHAKAPCFTSRSQSRWPSSYQLLRRASTIVARAAHRRPG